MRYITTVPMLFGKPINIWLGLVLLVVITVQISTGLAIFRGAQNLTQFHRFNGIMLGIIVSVHAYYGIGTWFFGFEYEE